MTLLMSDFRNGVLTFMKAIVRWNKRCYTRINNKTGGKNHES